MVHLPTETIREVVDEFFNVKVVELFVEAEQFVGSEFFNIEVEAEFFNIEVVDEFFNIEVVDEFFSIEVVDEFFNIEVVDEVFVFAAIRQPGFSRLCPPPTIVLHGFKQGSRSVLCKYLNETFH